MILEGQDTPDMDPTYEHLESLSYDSLRSIYRSTFLSDLDSATTVADILYEKALADNNKEQLHYALNNKATSSALHGHYGLAHKYIDEALAILNEIPDTVSPALTLYNAGYVYESIDKGEAVKYYYRALEEYQSQGDSATTADIYNNLGSMYMTLGNHDQALEYLLRAKRICENLPDKEVDPYILQNIGKATLKQGKYHEAIYHLSAAQGLFRVKSNPSRIIYSRAYKAEAYGALGLEEEAMLEIEAAFSLADSLAYDPGILFISPVLSRMHINSDLPKAERILNKAIDIPDAKKSYKDQAEIYLTASYIEQQKGNLEASLQMQKTYNLYRDSIALQYNEADVVKEELQIKHQQEIERVRQEHDHDQNSMSRRHLIQLITIVGMGILLLAGGSLLFARRLRKQKEEQTVLLHEIEKLKSAKVTSPTLQTSDFTLDRQKIETRIGKTVNETDWKVMNILLDDPVITNKGIAEKAFLSVDGIGSSLRRMYKIFDIKESRYMKVSLIMELMKISK